MNHARDRWFNTFSLLKKVNTLNRYMKVILNKNLFHNRSQLIDCIIINPQHNSRLPGTNLHHTHSWSSQLLCATFLPSKTCQGYAEGVPQCQLYAETIAQPSIGRYEPYQLLFLTKIGYLCLQIQSSVIIC